MTRTRRWWCGTSTTTPAGRSCSPPSSRAGPGSAWWAPSSPGTSLSCCSSGRQGYHLYYILLALVTIAHLLGRPCPRRGQHGGPEARDLHAAVRAAVRRDLRGGGAARRGLQRGDGGRRHGPGAGRAPARGQGGTLPLASLRCCSCCLYPRLRSPGPLR